MSADRPNGYGMLRRVDRNCYGDRGRMPRSSYTPVVKPMTRYVEMPRPHKGPRVLINITLPAVVVKRIDEDAQRCAVSSRSQLLADRVSAYFGRWDLARELNSEQLELVLPHSKQVVHASASGIPTEGDEEEVSLRVPREVANLIDREARRGGKRARRQHLAHLVSKLYDPEGVEEIREEQLELPARHGSAVA